MNSHDKVSLASLIGVMSVIALIVCTAGCDVYSILPVPRGDNTESQVCVNWMPGSAVSDQYSGFEVCGDPSD